MNQFLHRFGIVRRGLESYILLVFFKRKAFILQMFLTDDCQIEQRGGKIGLLLQRFLEALHRFLRAIALKANQTQVA